MFTPEPPDATALALFQTEIERIIPRSDTVSWLYSRWEAGDPWHPVGRVFLWQVLPLSQTSPDQWRALRGPHPRSTGHYCGGPGYCPTVNIDGKDVVMCGTPKRRWVGGPAMGWKVSRQQYEIHQEIGRYAEPWWVVQGENGGHRKTLFEWERGLLWHASGETRSNVPMAGDLPFAMPDARVITQIAKYDLLRDWEARHAKAFAERDANDMDAVEAAEREKLGAEWGRWLVEQSRELYDGAKSEWRTMASEYRSGGSNLRAQRQRTDAMMEAKWDALTSGLDVS